MIVRLKAGFFYFLIVFAAGFVLGTIRVLLLQPRIGAVAAVLAELPVMLVIAWVTCGKIVARWSVADRFPDRLAMGVVAFVLLMAAEFGLSVTAFGNTPAAYTAALLSSAGLIGLAGQIVFAALPLVRGRPS